LAGADALGEADADALLLGEPLADGDAVAETPREPSLASATTCPAPAASSPDPQAETRSSAPPATAALRSVRVRGVAGERRSDSTKGPFVGCADGSR
jgi:hypothetical protein